MAKIYGQLEASALENLSSDPTVGVIGRFWWNTTDLQAKTDDGTTIRALIRNDQKMIFGNSGTANNNVRVNRAANSVLQFVLGGDTTAEGSLSTSVAQISARVENYATGSLPAFGNAGRLLYDSTLNYLKYDNGSAIVPIDSGRLLTTKGDLLTFSTVPARQGVGADGTFLQADSSQTNGLKWAATAPSFVVTSQSSNYSAVAADFVLCTGTFDVTLPTAVGIAGQSIKVKTVAAGKVTILTTSAQTIDGYASGSIFLSNALEDMVFTSDGANWVIESYHLKKSRFAYYASSGNLNLSSLNYIQMTGSSASVGADITATTDGTDGNKLAVNAPGWATVTWQIDNVNGANVSRLFVNGGVYELNTAGTVGSTLNSKGTATLTVKVAAGDYFQVFTTGGSYDSVSGTGLFEVILDKEY